MGSKELDTYDFVLITDMHDKNYLHIGEVIGKEFYADGDVEKYTVRFGAKEEDLVEYKPDLTEKCKVLVLS